MIFINKNDLIYFISAKCGKIVERGKDGLDKG